MNNRRYKLPLGLAAAGALALAGGLASPGLAASSLTGGVVGCPNLCVDSGPVTGGGIRPDDTIRGIRITGTVKALVTQETTYRVGYGYVPGPSATFKDLAIDIAVPNAGTVNTLTLRDATITVDGFSFAGTVALTPNRVDVQSRNTNRRTFTAELAGPVGAYECARTCTGGGATMTGSVSYVVS